MRRARLPLPFSRRRLVAPVVEAGGGAPAWVGEVTRTTAVFDSTGSQAFTLSAGASVGQRLVAVIAVQSGVTSVASVADSKGNTWVVHAEQAGGGSTLTAIASTVVTVALEASDTVTVTFGAAAGSWRGAIFANLTDAGAVDDTAVASGFTATPSVSLTTSAAAVMVGAVRSSAAFTVNSTDGTQSGADYATGAGDLALIYREEASANTYAIGATLSAAANTATVGAAFIAA